MQQQKYSNNFTSVSDKHYHTETHNRLESEEPDEIVQDGCKNKICVFNVCKN